MQSLQYSNCLTRCIKLGLMTSAQPPIHGCHSWAHITTCTLTTPHINLMSGLYWGHSDRRPPRSGPCRFYWNHPSIGPTPQLFLGAACL